MRKYIAGCIIVGAAIIASALTVAMTNGLRGGGEVDDERALDPDYQAPLTIAVTTWTSSETACSWHLSVNSAGCAALTIETQPMHKRRQFVVTDTELQRVRQALQKERYFELGAVYGERVPEGSTYTIAVTLGDVTKSIRIHYLMNYVQDNRGKLKEPCRALRVGLIIRSWFGDVEAADHTDFDKRIVAAAGSD